MQGPNLALYDVEVGVSAVGGGGAGKWCCTASGLVIGERAAMTDPARTDCRRADGFTLLEVMVALVLLGALLAALGQGLRFGLTAWDLQEAQLAQSEALEATDRALRGMIERMDPATTRPNQHGILGTNDQMTFVGRLPAAAAISRRAEMAIIVASGGRLVLRWRPFSHEKPGGCADVQETLLLDGVDAGDRIWGSVNRALRVAGKANGRNGDATIDSSPDWSSRRTNGDIGPIS